MARPQKPFFADWIGPAGEHVTGLCRQPDGRWRILSTGERFSQTDPRKAVAYFKSKQPSVEVPILQLKADEATRRKIVKKGTAVFLLQTMRQSFVEMRSDPEAVQYPIPEAIYWSRVAEDLTHRPEIVAKMTGIAAVALLDVSAAPRQALRLAVILDAYKNDNASTNHTKAQVVNTFEKMMNHTDAKTLADLTTDRLITYRRHVEATVPASSTRSYYYSCTKRVISFALKMGLDQQQVRAAFDRCKVLWTGEKTPDPQPRPITRDEFQTLLKHGGEKWRTWLLLGLNLCMSIEEVCGLRWKSFDLDAGTFAAIRTKTSRKRIPRAATLWPETIAELRRIKRTENPFVLISKYGTRYNRNTRCNDFAELRTAAALPEDVTFSTLRDGAYTTACQAPGVDEKFARVLAGHKSAGLQDKYVLRNPEMTRPACEAVYRAYGPF